MPVPTNTNIATPAPALIALPVFGCVPADWLGLGVELPVESIPAVIKFVTVASPPPERLVVITTMDGPTLELSDAEAVVEELVYAKLVVLVYMEVMVGTGVKEVRAAVGGGDCGMAASSTGLRPRAAGRRNASASATVAKDSISITQGEAVNRLRPFSFKTGRRISRC
jgi:hypothetical protein